MRLAVPALLLLAACSGAPTPPDEPAVADSGAQDAPGRAVDALDGSTPQDDSSGVQDGAQSPYPDGESCCAACAQSWVDCCTGCMATCMEVDTAANCRARCGSGDPYSSCTPDYAVCASGACGGWCPAEPMACP